MSEEIYEWVDPDFPLPHLDPEEVGDVSPAEPDIDWESVEI